jgi:DNA-binding response OmpR family regulator
MSRRILIVEDDPHIRLGLVEILTGEGYTVTTARDGVEALARAKAEPPDLIVLDVMLPRKSGFDVCRELRAARQTVPILMLTAKGQETDKVVGLELGADDYVTKPFGVRELIARVQALLRRVQLRTDPEAAPDRIAFGTVEIDCPALRGRRGATAFALTPRELAVLVLLHRERGHAVSRDRILNEVWGIAYYGTTRTLDQLIVKLRQKVEEVPASPRHLLTVHGLGYRLEST